MTDRFSPHPGQQERPTPDQKHPRLVRCRMVLHGPEPSRTSATVLMISRCPVTRPAPTATVYRSGQPVNHYVLCSCYPFHRVYSRVSPPGFLLAGHEPYPAPSAAVAPQQQIFQATPGPLPPVVVPSTLSAGAGPFRYGRPSRRGNIPAACLFAVRQVFVLAILRTISSADVPFHGGWPLSLPCQLLCRDRFAISAPAERVSGISPTRPPVMVLGFHGRPSPDSPPPPLSGLSRAIRTPSYISASRLSRYGCLRSTNCASLAAFTRPSPEAPQPFPSSVVSGFSQIPADLRYGQSRQCTAADICPHKTGRTVSPPAS